MGKGEGEGGQREDKWTGTLTAELGEGRHDNVRTRDERVEVLVREVVVHRRDERQLGGYLDPPSTDEKELERGDARLEVRFERRAAAERAVAPCRCVLCQCGCGMR